MSLDIVSEQELQYLLRCVALAEEALSNGDQPFGSVLVSPGGQIRAEERNRVNSSVPTWHPEIALVRWAEENLSETQRRECAVFTSGEHCPMCAAAHAWADLGEIVYASSSRQFSDWCAKWEKSEVTVKPLEISEIAPGISTRGPVPELSDRIRLLHDSYFARLEEQSNQE